MLAEDLRYGPFAARWPRGPQLSVEFAHGGPDEPIVLPLVFLEGCGDNTHGLCRVSLLAPRVEMGVLALAAEPDSPLDPETVPLASRYIFTPLNSAVSFTNVRGPEWKKRYVPAPPGSDMGSSYSHSSRNSTNQNRFRESLIARDGHCHFTRMRYRYAVPAHIVPVSRFDAYLECLPEATPRTFSPYTVECVLFMNPLLHNSYDAFSWSLYIHPTTGKYIFHEFNPNDDRSRGHHGESIDPNTDMRREAPPDPRLCKWHYTQCVLKYVRGYSVGMCINAEGGFSGSVSHPSGS